eukprot:scpid95730/ scgid15266/ 
MLSDSRNLQMRCLDRREGCLFCGVCPTYLSEEKSSVQQHVKTRQHQEEKLDREKTSKRQQLYKDTLKQRDQARVAGDTLFLDHRAYRFEVKEIFLREGVLLAKVDGLRSLQEHLQSYFMQAYGRVLV